MAFHNRFNLKATGASVVGSPWVSQTIQINADTGVDVTADERRVVLGQHGDAWLEDLHMSPLHAIAIAAALCQGAAWVLQSQSETE